jgi:hypothetical protein
MIRHSIKAVILAAFTIAASVVLAQDAEPAPPNASGEQPVEVLLDTEAAASGEFVEVVLDTQTAEQQRQLDETWIRRVTLDLTGAPPSPAEFKVFFADKQAHRDKAYERFVERLLKSDSNVRAWAKHWVQAVHNCQDCHEMNDGRAEWRHTNVVHFVNAIAEKPRLGISVGPADAVLRAQLGLEEGQGVVITKVNDDSPAAKAGVAAHDLLLTINDHAIGSEEDLAKAMEQVAASKPMKLMLIQQGERTAKSIQASAPEVTAKLALAYRDLANAEVALNWVGQQGAGDHYRIGIHVAEVDPTLRTHLKLAEGEGVVVTEAIEGEPAKEAGFHDNDIVLRVNGVPIKGIEHLIETIRGSEGKAMRFEVLRGGERVTLKVAARKPEPVKGEPGSQAAPTYQTDVLVGQGFDLGLVNPNVRAWKLDAHLTADRINWAGGIATPGHQPANAVWAAGQPLFVVTDGSTSSGLTLGLGANGRVIGLHQPAPSQPADAAQRLDAIAKQLGQLQKSVDALRETMKQEPSKPAEPNDQ